MNYLHQEGFPAVNQFQSAVLQSVHGSALLSPLSTLIPSLGTLIARHSAHALQDFLQKEWISSQSRAEAGSGREVEPWPVADDAGGQLRVRGSRRLAAGRAARVGAAVW